jgi:hypothetical protein
VTKESFGSLLPGVNLIQLFVFVIEEEANKLVFSHAKPFQPSYYCQEYNLDWKPDGSSTLVGP